MGNHNQNQRYRSLSQENPTHSYTDLCKPKMYTRYRAQTFLTCYCRFSSLIRAEEIHMQQFYRNWRHTIAYEPTLAQILLAPQIGYLSSALDATVILREGKSADNLAWYFSAGPTVSTYTSLTWRKLWKVFQLQLLCYNEKGSHMYIILYTYVCMYIQS